MEEAEAKEKLIKGSLVVYLGRLYNAFVSSCS
jgi:hypothetical protein